LRKRNGHDLHRQLRDDDERTKAVREQRTVCAHTDVDPRLELLARLTTPVRDVVEGEVPGAVDGGCRGSERAAWRDRLDDDPIGAGGRVRDVDELRVRARIACETAGDLSHDG